LVKNCFVGAGLSAYFSQLLYWREGDVCLYPEEKLSPYPLRRSHLEIQKPFSSNAPSWGSNQYQLTQAALHDRSTRGGNSAIWGGFFDTSKVRQLDKFSSAGIQLVPLSYAATGSVSNIQSLVQLQESNGKILNASNHLRTGNLGYLNSIHCEPGQIKLKCLAADNLKTSEIKVDGKVFVCTGVVQTIDVLMRSQLIQPGDELTLDEFAYTLALGGEPAQNEDQEACVISFTPGRAAGHWLGIQKANHLSLFKPFAIHQIFHPRKQTLSMAVGDHALIEKAVTADDGKSASFGQSIHYCNLKINGERLHDLAARLSPNLHFVNMGAVVQAKPGPISSDIWRYLESIGNEL
jgi:hypothetical protein